MELQGRMKGHAAMAINGIIFGLNIPVSKWVMASGHIDPVVLTMCRMCGGAVLFWAVSVIMPRERVALRDVFLLLAASCFGVIINQMSFVMGLGSTSPVNASIIAAAVPIFTMLLAAVFVREPITWLKGLGVAIGAAGALLLVLGSADPGGLGGHIKGDMLCLLSAISFSVYLTLFKPLIMRYSPITLMKWMFLWAAVICTPLGYSRLEAVEWSSMPWSTIAGISYVVFMATFFTYMLMPVGQKLLRPTVVSMYNYLQPLVASLVAVAIGQDSFGWGKTLAGVMVFLGVWVVTKSKSRAQLDAERYWDKR